MRNPYRKYAQPWRTLEEATDRAIADMSPNLLQALESICKARGRDLREHIDQQIMQARKTAQREMRRDSFDALRYVMTGVDPGRESWTERVVWDTVGRVVYDDDDLRSKKEIIVEYNPEPKPKKPIALLTS